MVTLEQWKEFQEYRNKKIEEFAKGGKVWTVFILEENTIEACMDWLLSKKEIQNDPQKPK